MNAKLHLFVDTADEKMLMFECPGCGCGHWIRVRGKEPCWQWNGSMDKPTFGPSILVFADEPDRRCHSYVKDGQIEFLSDSYHKLAGSTVDLPNWEDAVGVEI